MPRSRALAGLALGVLAFGLWFRLVEYGWIAGPALDTTLIAGKERLALPRVLHALALAYLVASWVPREAGWMRTRLGLALAAVGRHSLHVFCIGLFLSWAAATVFAAGPGHRRLDPLLIGAGAAVLVAFALAADRRRSVAARAT